MENIEENVVTKGASAGDPMAKGPGWEDLGGPTPENSKPDDDSNKLKTPGATLAQVKDVVNAKAAKADSAPKEAVSDEVEDGQEVVAEDETANTEDTVSEEEVTTDEVVAEEPAKEGEEVVAEEETAEEEVIAETEAINVDDDVKALLEGEELSEEFQEKAKTIFEAAIKSKVEEVKANLEESYAATLVEEIDTVKSQLTERLDSYLEYVADEWVQENKLAIENGIKGEMTESFLNGMKQLFEDHYVTIPEEKYDVLESMVDKLDEMEGKLNEQIEKNVSLNKRLAESEADVIFADVAEGLAVSQKEKLASLAENVEFESETDYREKLVTLKESYFPSGKSSAPKSNSENLSEEVSTDEVVSQETTPRMQAYLDTLSRAAKK
tara:strand:+ start:589 stop:1734 length:1146 start_codon:yes stop_codon:yes gene_type:complete